VKVMLDTNICIYIIKRNPQTVLDTLVSMPTEDVGLSVVTVAELRFGASKSAQPRRNHEALDRFFSPFNIALFDEPAAKTYGTIRTALESQGRPIGPMDLLIAAHALSLKATLVTNNTKEFEQVTGLAVDDWV